MLRRRGGFLVSGMVVVALAGCRSATPAPSATNTPPALVGTARPSSAPVATATPSLAAVASPATPRPAAPATPAAASPTTPASPVVSADRGLLFGNPSMLGSNNRNVIAVPVTNLSDLVKSFTVRAVYQTGGRTVATATGTVDDLPPGQLRAVFLVADAPIPTTYDSARIEVATMVREEKSTPAADTAAKITFGTPVVKAVGATTTIDVDVTNTDTVAHTFSLQAIYVAGVDLIGVATGGVNDLAAGQTRSATLLLQGSAAGDPRLVIDTLAK